MFAAGNLTAPLIKIQKPQKDKMKFHQAKDFLPIIQAAAAGKTIQGSNASSPGGWEDYQRDEIMTFHNPANYRIKPEKKLRAWKAEEVPVGALVRRMSPRKHFCVAMIVRSCSEEGIEIGQDSAVSFEDASITREHSIDGGKTWLPCGVLE